MTNSVPTVETTAASLAAEAEDWSASAITAFMA
jgi:hypothetical protein